MRIIKGMVLTFATLLAALVGGMITAGVYQRIRYPGATAEGTDVAFDIGFAFLLGFVAILTSASAWFVSRFWKRRVS